MGVMIWADRFRPDATAKWMGLSSAALPTTEFMRESTYDELKPHKGDHERLLDEIRDIMDSVEDNRDIDDQALGARLEAWFARHFETHDARLHRRLGDHPTA
jgi:hemerythrin